MQDDLDFKRLNGKLSNRDEDWCFEHWWSFFWTC